MLTWETAIDKLSYNASTTKLRSYAVDNSIVSTQHTYIILSFIKTFINDIELDPQLYKHSFRNKHTCSIGHSQEHDKDETNQAVITMDTESVTMVTECVTMDTE